MKEKLFKEIVHMIANSVYPLNAFLTQMLHGYQIDNVVYMIEGLKSGRTPQELLKMADPLGFFEELKTVQPVEGEDYINLYQNVLIDLPVGVYFRKFLEEEIAGQQKDDNHENNAHYIAEVMQDYGLDQIQLRVKKIWLQEFHKFCTTQLNETSAAVMDDLIKYECDCRTIQVIVNSFSVNVLKDARGQHENRKKYITNLGYLVPAYFCHEVANDNAEMKNLNGVKAPKELEPALEGTNYASLMRDVQWEEAGEQRNEAENDKTTIDDVLSHESSRRYSMAFENGFHFGVFFAYLKLKEQEIKNVTWLGDLVQMNLPKNMPGWNKFTVPFKYHIGANGGYE